MTAGEKQKNQYKTSIMVWRIKNTDEKTVREKFWGKDILYIKTTKIILRFF